MIEPPIDGSQGTTPPDSDDALRHLKASEATEAALAAAGYRAAPDAVRAMIASSVKSMTKGIPVGSLSSSSGLMAAAAASEVNAAIACLSESQCERLKQSEEPDAATLAAIRRHLHDGLGSLRAFGAGTPADGGGNRDLSGGDGAKTMGASVRSNDYQMILGLSSAESLQRLSSGNWGRDPASVPFVKAGVNFGTVDYLRKYDKSFTGKDVLKAAGDVKQLGFDVNDHRMMRDQALIRHYDYDPDGTFNSEKKFNEEIKGDENLHELWRKRAACTDPGQQKVLDAQIAAAKDEHKKSSGVHDRLADAKRSPQAKKGLDDATEKMFETERAHALQHGPSNSRAVTPQQPNNRKSEIGNEAAADRAKIKDARRDAGQTQAGAESDLLASAGLPASPAPTKKAEAPPTAAPSKPSTKTASKSGPSPSAG